MKKWNNSGMTLVEIIVALAIAAVVLAATTGILLASGNFFTVNVLSNQAKQIGDTVYNWVSNEAIYATHLQIIEEKDIVTQPLYSNTIRVKDGKLLYKTADAPEYNFYGSDFYNGTTVQMKAKVLGSSLLQLTITVSRDGTEKYKTGSVVEVLNLRLAKGAIEGMVYDRTVEWTNPTLVLDETSRTVLGRTPEADQLYDRTLKLYNDFIQDKKSLAAEELEKKYGMKHINNDGIRNYYKNNGGWPRLDLDVAPYSVTNSNNNHLYVKGDLKEKAPFDVQIHVDIQKDGIPSIIVYAVPAKRGDDHYAWKMTLCYNQRTGIWYTPYPTTGGTKLGNESDMKLTAPRTDDKFYDQLEKIWNPLQ